MIKIEVVTPSCAEGECFMYDLSKETEWKDILLAVSILHPDATSIFIAVEEG